MRAPAGLGSPVQVRSLRQGQPPSLRLLMPPPYQNSAFPLPFPFINLFIKLCNRNSRIHRTLGRNWAIFPTSSPCPPAPPLNKQAGRQPSMFQLYLPALAAFCLGSHVVPACVLVCVSVSVCLYFKCVLWRKTILGSVSGTFPRWFFYQHVFFNLP